jgi:hypothetical protein
VAFTLALSLDFNLSLDLLIGRGSLDFDRSFGDFLSVSSLARTQLERRVSLAWPSFRCDAQKGSNGREVSLVDHIE